MKTVFTGWRSLTPGAEQRYAIARDTHDPADYAYLARIYEAATLNPYKDRS